MSIQTISRTKRRKPVSRPSGYYGALSNELAEQGPTELDYSKTTNVNLSGVWKRWQLYCDERFPDKYAQDPVEFIQAATAADYKAFCNWILDKYPGVQKKSSLHQYWRQAKMLYKRHARKRLHQDLIDDVNKHITKITRKYQLDISPPKRPVLSVDGLLVLLHHNMVLDTTVLPDEEHRILIALLLLFAAYTGARPVSLVDASMKDPAERTTDKVRDPAIRFYDSSEEDEDDTSATESGSSESVPESEQLKSILYEHVTLVAVRVQGRVRLAMWVTLIHTKGEDRKPQPKTFKMYQNKNPLLCPIAHMVALGLHHNAFAASSISSPEAILRAHIPARKSCRIFRWKKDMLQTPVFREPARARGQALSESPATPLRAQTAARYLKRLGRDVGMEQSVTQSCIRRGVGNGVDSSGTVGERDQVMGHSYSEIFQFYINPNVKCDVQAAFLEEPSDKILMKVLGSMSLTRDPLAPTRLEPDDARSIQQDPTVVRLRLRRDALTKEIKDIQQHPELSNGAKRKVELIDRRKAAEADLRQKKKLLRDRLMRRIRQRYFAENDTRELEEEDDLLLDGGDENNPTMVYALKERASVVALLSRSPVDLDEPDALDRRIQLVRYMKELCCRREARRRVTASKALPPTTSEDENVTLPTPLECDRRQCLFCIGDRSLPASQRTFCWSRPSKMMDHIEKIHLYPLEPDSRIPCPHPGCRDNKVVLDGVSHFKAHALRIHKITLRFPKVTSF
ncbi:DUF3435 domain-containing protein [Pyrenophora tritici-repentis]|nr:DUF3435 domain-containing protein [Pyrenophora tritici-repentis]